MGNQTLGFISRTVSVDSVNYVYQLFVPSEIEMIQNIPVIVFLHALHERGTGGFVTKNSLWGKIIKEYFQNIPAIIFLPQCRSDTYWSDPRMDRMVIQALNQTLKEYSGDLNRIYLVGVSLGGYGVWHFGFRHPEKFAALVPICGGSPLLTGDRFTPVAEKIGKTPVWVFHGALDTVVSVNESRALVNSLKEHGGIVKYNEYANVGHMVWLQVLAEKELMPWLLSQHK